MKKKSLIILVVLLVILIPTYALNVGKEKNEMEKPTSTKLENKEPERGENQGITVNKLEVIYVNPSEAEKTLGTSYTSIKRLKGYKLITVNNDVYLYIGLGKKNTGGYVLEVVNLEDSEGILNVQVNIQQPKEGDIVTQAITYPHKVLKLNFMPTKVNIKSMNTEDTFEEVVPEGVTE